MAFQVSLLSSKPLRNESSATNSLNFLPDYLYLDLPSMSFLNSQSKGCSLPISVLLVSFMAKIFPLPRLLFLVSAILKNITTSHPVTPARIQGVLLDSSSFSHAAPSNTSNYALLIPLMGLASTSLHRTKLMVYHI